VQEVEASFFMSRRGLKKVGRCVDQCFLLLKTTVRTAELHLKASIHDCLVRTHNSYENGKYLKRAKVTV
jgi:hypothetical protein